MLDGANAIFFFFFAIWVLLVLRELRPYTYDPTV
jgi:hypothetical protein